MPLVHLEVVDSARVDRYGGKGARLADLYQAGFKVPPGYILEAPLIGELLRETNLDEHILNLREAMGTEKQVSASLAVEKAIEGMPIPLELVGDLERLLRNLGALAVRSSACTEDGFVRSAAGQYRTVLGVDSTEDLLRAIRQVVASQYQPHALRYRGGEGSLDCEMAVVLQRIIAARCSGVAATADPLGIGEDQVIVEASRGLGVAVVNGTAIAERSVLARPQLRVESRTLRRQAHQDLYSSQDGLRAHAIPDSESQPVLSTAELEEVALIACAIEDRLKGAIEMEWAIDGSGLWVLQARPLTGSGVV